MTNGPKGPDFFGMTEKELLALLNDLLTPNAQIKKYQDEGNYTMMLAMQEEIKTLPFGAVWDEYCERCGVPVGKAWYDEVVKYENEVLLKR